MASQANFSPLISAQELFDLLGKDDVGLVDCRFSLDNTDRGRSDWSEERIDGAVYAHLDEDLSAPISDATEGRHPMPPPDTIARLRAGWGFDNSTLIVCYADAGGAFAGRLWWMLRWIGHESVRVLDGGWPAWKRGGFPTNSTLPGPAQQKHAQSLNYVTREDWAVRASELHGDHNKLVDARATERYEGRVEPIDPVAGHIPGAQNLPWQGNLGSDGHFLPADTLTERWEAVGGTDQTIVYCGSGVTACHNILAAAIAGLALPRLFPPSWSGWISNPENPIEQPDS